MKYNRDICRLLLQITVIYSRSYAYKTSVCFVGTLCLNVHNNGGRYNAYYGSCLYMHKLKATSFGLSEPQSTIQTFWCLCWYLAWLSLQAWKWRRYVPPKLRAYFELRDATGRKTGLFKWYKALFHCEVNQLKLNGSKLHFCSNIFCSSDVMIMLPWLGC
jgi:hypothetical protein